MKTYVEFAEAQMGIFWTESGLLMDQSSVGWVLGAAGLGQVLSLPLWPLSITSISLPADRLPPLGKKQGCHPLPSPSHSRKGP